MREILLAQNAGTNFVLFILIAGGIWLVGSRLTYLADAISERFRLAASTVGLVFLALATSLPEVATTASAAIKQNADLVLNNLFGGIALQTAMLALADFWAKSAITNYPRKTNHALEAILLVALMAGLQAVLILGEPVSILNVGMGSIIVGIAYVGSIQLLRWSHENSDWVPVDLPDSTEVHAAPVSRIAMAAMTPLQLMIASMLAFLSILILGISIVEVSEVLAFQTGLGTGFFGVTFLAAATSLPELSTTITAVRMGAYTMAISNVFGSNLIMIVLILPADMLHHSGPILGAANPSTQLAIATGILVTAIYLIGLIVRRKPRVGNLGIDSFVVLIIYAISIILYYFLR